MTSQILATSGQIFRADTLCKMAEMTEVAALRLQNEELKAEVARLKATRSAIYKLYLESEGKKNPRHSFSRIKVFEALQLSADPDKKEPAPKKEKKEKEKKE